MVANELRRDGTGIFQNDNFAVVLDTFFDRRNGFYFYTNPLGAISDGQLTDESDTNRDWNAVWNLRTGRFQGGWTVEFEIPFKSLRYNPGKTQLWGINFRRVVRSKNEWSYLTKIDPAFGYRGMTKMSRAAVLTGLEVPRQPFNLDVKPYLKSGLRTDLSSLSPYENKLAGDVGLDGKYGVTKGLNFDFTYNTDFAEVEDDEQRLNLTRFNLFFPEKREFFLEGQGIFAFGGRQTTRRDRASNDTPILFFSRRIGLDGQNIVPTRVGGRLTGRAGKYTVGALFMQTDELSEKGVPATGFSVLRIKRDVFQRSNIGIIATHRSQSLSSDGSNSVLGADANLTFFQNMDINAYYSRTETSGVNEGQKDNESYRGRFSYGTDSYGVELEHLVVGDDFNPEIGFLRRSDFAKSGAVVRVTPRMTRWASIRKLEFEGSFNYINDGDGELETQLGRLTFGTNFENGDSFKINYQNSVESLKEPFKVDPRVVISPDIYKFQYMTYNYRLGPQRPLSGSVNFQHGDFFNGNRIELRYRGRVEVSPYFSIEPNVSFNWVNLQEGSFATRLLSSRINYTQSARTSFSALVQYNSLSNAVSGNIRFRWEYQPGSDLYVVYNDVRDGDLFGFTQVSSRAFIVKFTRLFRF